MTALARRGSPMKPVAIFRFSPTEGPAYLSDWLHARGIAFDIIALDAGMGVPSDPRAFSGLAMMGGPMSANDSLPWTAPLCALLRDAVDARVPVIGHCLGGQLLARALGAAVCRAPQPEIGWSDVETEGALGASWFGGARKFTTFQWHYDTFALPPNATRVLRNDTVANQAYVVDDLHLGMQCHVEMTAELVQTWCEAGAAELPERSSGAMQSAADIRRATAARLPGLRRVAASVYERWARGLPGTEH